MEPQGYDQNGEQTYVINGQVYTQSQVEQMYAMQQQMTQSQPQMDQNAEEGEQTADSRIVKTVRSLRRQNSASRGSLTHQEQPTQHQFQQQQQQQVQQNIQQQREFQQMNQAQFRQMNYTGDNPNQPGPNSVLQHMPPQNGYQSKPQTGAVGGRQQPLTSFQRRQMEAQKKEQGGGGAMSLEERLAKLKQVHQKPQIQMRRPQSGSKMTHRNSQQQVMVSKKPSQPLDPIEFQQQLAKRSAEEKEKMDQFKQHEEKMKAYQENRQRKEKPPMAQSTAKLQHQNNENQPPIIVPKIKGGKAPRERAVKAGAGTSSMRRSSNNNVGGQSSTTTAGTNEGRDNHNSSQMELEDSDDEKPQRRHVASTPLNIQNETGQRGAKPESNENLESEVTLVGSKKEKMIEVFRNCTEIREMITSKKENSQNMDLQAIINSLFENQHFLNMLGDLLTKRAATTKLEKFFAQQVKLKLREAAIDKGIQDCFQNINKRMQDRLNKIRETELLDPDNYNQSPEDE